MTTKSKEFVLYKAKQMVSEVDGKLLYLTIFGSTLYGTSRNGKSDLEKHLIIEPYRYDYRINWDTYIVYLPDQGILGFTDGPVE